METKANHIVVGVVTLVLLALMAGAILWVARLNEGDQNDYDIFFKQSVDGLAKGSEVAYAGVPVGQITQIELWKRDPSFVRVRIAVRDEVPITVGTTATIQGSFTGVSDIQLEGAIKGAPAITEPGPEGVPVIPTKQGGLGAILSNAPLLLERLATLTEKLNQLLSDDNQKSIQGILANTSRMTDQLADASPEVKSTFAELRGTLAQASQTLAEFENVAGKADELLGEEGSSLAVQLRDTLNAAQGAANQLDKTLASAQPALKQISENTIPAADATIRDLRITSRALRKVTEKIDQGGAGELLGGQKLPEYEP